MFTWDFPYPSQRMPVIAENVVATSQPLAAQAGLRMILKGGNAVDAALAAAITLTVVEPTSNGIGSDAFALIWDGGQLYGLNGSGHSPAAWSPEYFAKYQEYPLVGWDTVTVPGAVSAWRALSERFGRLPFADLFDPAIFYAEQGYGVSPITARSWQLAQQKYQKFPEFAKIFLPAGRAPHAGERFRCAAMARTLQEIAETNAESFYRGRLAEAIVHHAQATGGLLIFEDLAQQQADWVTPISHNFLEYTLHEIPPNGQGIAALMMLGILSHTNIADYAVDSADSLHVQIEAMKLAFADVHHHVADPAWMHIDAHALLEPEYLRQRAKSIDMRHAHFPKYGMPQDKDTVYLTAADASGMMVSYIQSNYMGFGSGIVIPNTGISLQNRGCGFSLEPGHPNQVAGGKRPYHTIIPSFVTRDRQPVMSFGVMGGHMQPQGHAQMMLRIFKEHQNPQAANDAPRWHLFQNFQVGVEPGFDPDVLNELAARGHKIVTECAEGLFGGAQLIYKHNNVYVAASDPRKDGQAVGF
ncbi:gamma-glutamyltransferase [Candidatus Vecturithrix granuli]|uniref:Gamma-glutamyltransferase n=1 Tax=Vecturithrix granuli TaxID=1499967 RepID=A0A0S6W6I5_VECG1|nr:gamma-glutamyltransferase [Candidatus Vecturithrix granuli]